MAEKEMRNFDLRDENGNERKPSVVKVGTVLATGPGMASAAADVS